MNEILESALKTGHVAGAYLVEGASAEAVAAQTDAFLMHLFCDEKKACGVCGGCVKYKNKSHADIMVIDEDGKSIKVDAVRGISSFVYNKSYEAGFKAVIIPEANLLTDQAQNAILKVLEEPPKDTVFLLGTLNCRNLLPTILSRCIIVKTHKSVDDAENKLKEEFALSTIKARVLLCVAEQEYYLARKYAQQQYFEMRDDAVLVLNRLLYAKTMATSATEKLILKYEQQINLFIIVLLLYLKDVLNYKHTGNTVYVANEDVIQEIKKHALLSDLVLVNTSELLTAYVTRCEKCLGMNKKLELTGLLFNILEVVI